MTIRLISLKRYSEFMSDLVSIQNVSRVNSKFGVSNRKSIEENLLNEASKYAKKQATLMAESLDTKLVSLYAVSKASNFSRFFATFGAMSEISTEYDVGGGSSDSVNTKTFAPKTIKIKQNINVVFRIK